MVIKTEFRSLAFVCLREKPFLLSQIDKFYTKMLINPVSEIFLCLFSKSETVTSQRLN